MNRLKLRIRKRKKKKPEKNIKHKITKQRFLAALDDSFGIVKTLAEKMKVSYNSVRAYIKNAPEDIKELLQNEREKLADVAEETMAEMMQQRLHFPTALSSSKFVLTNAPQSKKKGYKDKKELTVQGGEKPLKIENSNIVSLDKIKTLSLEDRKKMLVEIEEMKDEDQDQD